MDREHLLWDDGDEQGAAVMLMPCDADTAYNLEQLGKDDYCLTIAAPGHDRSTVLVTTAGGYLRIRGVSELPNTTGEMLHRGLAEQLDRTFLMLCPLDVTKVDAYCGLCRIYLRRQPGQSVAAVMPPRCHCIEAVPLAA